MFASFFLLDKSATHDMINFVDIYFPIIFAKVEMLSSMIPHIISFHQFDKNSLPTGSGKPESLRLAIAACVPMEGDGVTPT